MWLARGGRELARGARIRAQASAAGKPDDARLRENAAIVLSPDSTIGLQSLRGRMRAGRAAPAPRERRFPFAPTFPEGVR